MAGASPGHRFANWVAALGRGLLTGDEVEAISIHDLAPRRDEVLHELLLRVRAPIDFRESAKLRVRAEDQIDPGGGPLDLFGLAVAALVHAIGVRGLPLGV